MISEYIYAFGSVCRGELDIYSDIDLLLISNSTVFDDEILKKYSVYDKLTLEAMWQEGNPFAWHLFKESILIYSKLGDNYIVNLQKPKSYKNGSDDCIKFYEIFNDAKESIRVDKSTLIFDLSNIFLAIRNFATCFSLSYLKEYNFSRHSALNMGKYSIQISDEGYKALEKSRILSSRGKGELLTSNEVNAGLGTIQTIDSWFKSLMKSM